MQQTIADALAAWEAAPVHVRMMAGAYVGPVLAALVDVGERVGRLHERVAECEIRQGVSHGA